MNPTLAIRSRFILSATRPTSARILTARCSSLRIVKRGFVDKSKLFTARSEVDPSPSTGSNPTMGSASPLATGPPPSGSGPSTGSNPNLSGMHSEMAGAPSGSNPPPPFPPGAQDPTVVKGSKAGAWFTALLITGLAFTAYGLGEVWGSMTIWPKELRWDLRHGLRENEKGEKGQAEIFLGRAWNRARVMDIKKFGDDAYLKTTGIAIALAAVYESQGKLSEAYHTLTEALQHLQLASPLPVTTGQQRVDMEAAPSPVNIVGETTSAPLKNDLSPRERMRAVAISYKLSELAELLKLPKEQEEKWLVYSVETVLRDVMQRPGVAEVVVKEKDPKTGQTVTEGAGLLNELQLPRWVLKHDLAAPFEALGTFYAHSGQIQYAMPLYLQAIAILIPPRPQVSSADDQCRAAQLMGNISELIIRASAPADSPVPPPEALSQAESWASKALEVAGRVRQNTFKTHPICEVAYAFALFNLGIIKEMSGDETQAQLLFTRTLDQSKAIGFEAGILNAKDAIRNLGKRAFGTAAEASLDMGDAVVGSKVGGLGPKRGSAESIDETSLSV